VATRVVGFCLEQKFQSWSTVLIEGQKYALIAQKEKSKNLFPEFVW
jgi:hypothetical protein